VTGGCGAASSVLQTSTIAEIERVTSRRIYHFVVAVWRPKNGDAIGGGGDESDEALA